MNKGIIAIIVILLIGVVAAGLYFAMQAPANNTTNISNQTNTTPVITNTTNKTNTTNTTTITAARAKELASQYTGMGVTLGTPTLTTYKGVQVWMVPVSTSGQNLSVDSIYINAKTGVRVQ